MANPTDKELENEITKAVEKMRAEAKKLTGKDTKKTKEKK